MVTDNLLWIKRNQSEEVNEEKLLKRKRKVATESGKERKKSVSEFGLTFIVEMVYKYFDHILRFNSLLFSIKMC